MGRQEVRFAVALTGGVSLAIWIGGVARELNLLASATSPAGQPGALGTPLVTELRARYAKLLELLDVDVSIDILSGTSAGGINAAVLGLCGVRGCDMDGLRNMWLKEGSFEDLLRPPDANKPTSLLQGDGVLLAGLRAGLYDLAPTPASPGPTDDTTRVLITTTLLRGQPYQVKDDLGTVISDEDHHGLFTFTTEQLNDGGVVPALALAARCSASFPIAFEPGFVPIGGAAQDETHPDMSQYIGLSGSEYVADGGLLANRPLRPALNAIFDRPAAEDVRRVLAYIVPTTSAPVAPELLTLKTPPDLMHSALADLDATMSQSITNELAAIQEHNEQVTATVDLRTTLIELACEGARLLTNDLFSAFCDRAAHDIVDLLAAEVHRQAVITPLPYQTHAHDPFAQARDLADLADNLAAHIRRQFPQNLDTLTTEQRFGAFGRSVYDAAKSTVLSLIRGARARAATDDARASLNHLRGRLHAVLIPQRASPIDRRQFIAGHRAPTGDILGDHLRDAVEEWYRTWHQPEELNLAWRELGAIARDGALDVLNQDPLVGAPVDDGRYRKLAVIHDYLKNAANPTLALFDLVAATRALTPGLPRVEQRLELVQISADTRTALDLSRSFATKKLTGLQLHHFGAFYKRSWRASDWMWGRIDGIGWLVHILLDPRRLRVAEKDEKTLFTRLAEIRDGVPAGVVEFASLPENVQNELRSVFDPNPPPTLPETAIWVAKGLQRLAAAQELGWVAREIERDVEDGAYYTQAARQFVNDYKESVTAGLDLQANAQSPPYAPLDLNSDDVGKLFRACRVSDETLRDDIGSRLSNRVVVHTLAVAAGVINAMSQLPVQVKPALVLAKWGTRLANLILEALDSRRHAVARTALGSRNETTNPSKLAPSQVGDPEIHLNG